MKLRKQKESTKSLVIALEKHSKASKSGLWKDIANRISKPRRSRVSVNLWKLQKLSEEFGGKTLIVPGKVLGYGAVSRPLNIAALEFSDGAKEKIEGAKGSASTISDIIGKNQKASSMMIVSG